MAAGDGDRRQDPRRREGERHRDAAEQGRGERSGRRDTRSTTRTRSKFRSIPKIDLAVDKIDSKDPVKPGETFTYTVTVINNGPSNATGVTVVDTLPASGVTYVSSSRAVSVNGRELTYDLGDMASGATVTFTITVQVEPELHRARC